MGIVTTHYDALKGMAEGDGRFVNAGMAYDLKRCAPLFRLEVGRPGRSYAFDIAARIGFPSRCFNGPAPWWLNGERALKT